MLLTVHPSAKTFLSRGELAMSKEKHVQKQQGEAPLTITGRESFYR